VTESKFLGETKIKKLNPKKGYLAPYIQLPWGYREDLIGQEAKIFELEGGFFIKIGHEEFKLQQPLSLEFRVKALESNVERVLEILHQQWIHPNDNVKKST